MLNNYLKNYCDVTATRGTHSRCVSLQQLLSSSFTVPVPYPDISPSASVPMGTGADQRPLILTAPENPYYRPVSFNSIPLSEFSPFGGDSPIAFSGHFLPLCSPLHPRCPLELTRDENECIVILQNGCACAPELTRPPSPAALPSEPSSSTGGGPWVRVPFTNWHASSPITLHNILN